MITLTDDEIVFVSHNHPGEMLCQFCGQDLTALTVPQREHHYDEHLSEASQASTSKRSGETIEQLSAVKRPLSKTVFKSSSKMPAKTRFKASSHLHHSPSYGKQNVFWYSSQETDPPQNFSPGLISVLKRALSRSHDRGTTERAWLAFERAIYIQGEGWDRMWGCGYRNFLMACAALMDQQIQPVYFALLDSPSPGVRNLQLLLEEAWTKGYDEEGASQLDHELVGTRKWIGTAELYVAFTYRGIPAQLVDFDMGGVGVEPLVRWICNYFSGDDPRHKVTTVGEALRGARPVIVTNKLPIILQRQGHSLTIVGYEQVKGGCINLLTFDPSRTLSASIRQAGLKYHSPSRWDEPGFSNASASYSKVLDRVMHSVDVMKSRKRKSPDLQVGPSKRKCLEEAEGKEVIVVEDDEDEGEDVNKRPPQAQRLPEPDAPDPLDVLKTFRIDTNSRSFKKGKKYQILYFPLEEPLSGTQKLGRMTVTSEKIC